MFFTPKQENIRLSIHVGYSWQDTTTPLRQCLVSALSSALESSNEIRDQDNNDETSQGSSDGNGYDLITLAGGTVTNCWEKEGREGRGEMSQGCFRYQSSTRFCPDRSLRVQQKKYCHAALNVAIQHFSPCEWWQEQLEQSVWAEPCIYNSFRYHLLTTAKLSIAVGVNERLNLEVTDTQ